MEKIQILEQRLARAAAALRNAKRREVEREQVRVFELIRRSGLTLGEVESLLSSATGNAAKGGTENAPCDEGNES